MYQTNNDIHEKNRAALVELLNDHLADAIDLQTQCKQADWNVKGSSCLSLHELFEKLNEGVGAYVDDIAERAVKLGGIAEGTARIVAKRTSLTEYAAKTGTGREHVESLSSALVFFGRSIRQSIAKSTELGDADTTDLFTKISRGIDKWLWFVDAHLQAER
jgi:starvation-inducible DNA-binding protein